MTNYYKDNNKIGTYQEDPFGTVLPITINVKANPKMMKDK